MQIHAYLVNLILYTIPFPSAVLLLHVLENDVNEDHAKVTKYDFHRISTIRSNKQSKLKHKMCMSISVKERNKQNSSK